MDVPTSLTPEQISHFKREGFVIVPDVFDPADLEPLRQALHTAISDKAKELKTAGKLENEHTELGFDQ
ncbi:MAG: mitomycin antibiotic biosynthesis protein, partial [Opitutaceae bacterium]|nr:mitomycin antibiotic biosynthesis protein [Opitutaceae bacterium]